MSFIQTSPLWEPLKSRVADVIRVLWRFLMSTKKSGKTASGASPFKTNKVRTLLNEFLNVIDRFQVNYNTEWTKTICVEIIFDLSTESQRWNNYSPKFMLYKTIQYLSDSIWFVHPEFFPLMRKRYVHINISSIQSFFCYNIHEYFYDSIES